MKKERTTIEKECMITKHQLQDFNEMVEKLFDDHFSETSQELVDTLFKMQNVLYPIFEYCYKNKMEYPASQLLGNLHAILCAKTGIYGLKVLKKMIGDNNETNK